MDRNPTTPDGDGIIPITAGKSTINVGDGTITLEDGTVIPIKDCIITGDMATGMTLDEGLLKRVFEREKQKRHMGFKVNPKYYKGRRYR